MRHFLKTLPLVCLLLAAGAPGVSHAQTAQNISWTGNGDGSSWTDAANWNPQVVPTASDTAYISLSTGSSYTVNVSAGRTVGGLTLASTDATLSIVEPLTVTGTLNLRGGTLSGLGEYVVEGGFAWNGGSMTGSGATTVNSDAVLSGTQSLRLSERTLTFNGATSVEVVNTDYVSHPAVDLQNGATLAVGQNGVLSLTQPKTGLYANGVGTVPVINNRGTITSALRGSGSVQIGSDTQFDGAVNINNSGAIKAASGNISMYFGPSSSASGSLIAQAGTNLELNQASSDDTAPMEITGTVSGAGRVTVRDFFTMSGAWDVTGSTAISASTCGVTFAAAANLQSFGDLSVSGYRCSAEVQPTGSITVPSVRTESYNQGTSLTLTPDLTVTGDFRMNGTVGGPGDVTVQGVLNWGRDGFVGSGVIDVNDLSTFAPRDGDFRTYGPTRRLDGTTLIVRDTARWDEGELAFSNQASMTIKPNAVFLMQRDGSITGGYMTNVTNEGTFRKTGVGVRFRNQQTRQIETERRGTTFETNFVNKGTLSIESGRIRQVNTKLTNAGRVQGTDTLDLQNSDAIFDNSGEVAPGTSPGILKVEGDYSHQTADLEVELGGTVVGNDYDQLKVSGTATLSGTMDVQLANDFSPAPADTFTVVQAGAVSDTFDTVNVPSGSSLNVVYEPERALLVAPLNQNSPPVAVNDTVTIAENAQVTPIDVTANDSDSDGDSVLLTEIVEAPAHGAASLGDTNISYTPDSGFSGKDVFTYAVSDGQGGADQATVVVFVQPAREPLTANDDAYETTANQALNVEAPGVLANDSGADELVAVRGEEGPSHGELTFNSNGSFSYFPFEGFQGEDSFTYRINDSRDSVDQATVVISVLPANTPPVARNDSLAVQEDDSTRISVLDNDSASDKSTLVLASVEDAAHGRAESNGNVVSYVPDPDFNGRDRFTYAITDGSGGADTAQVIVEVTPVNDAPVAAIDTAQTQENEQIGFIDVLANDTDVDGDELSLTGVGAPAHGAASINDGGVRYTPEVDYVGLDSLSYTVSDNAGGDDQAKIIIGIFPGSNNAPIAQSDTFQVTNGNTLTVDAPGVLANDRDPDGDSLTALLASPAGAGNLNFDADGSFTYTPSDSAVGMGDTFTYQAVDDSKATSEEARVTILVYPQAVTRQDSLALAALYESTRGANWNESEGWLEAPVAEWQGVVVEKGRVTQLRLSNNQLEGALPSAVGDLTALHVLDLAENHVDDLPDLSGLSKLERLFVAHNRLTFEDIEPNVGVAGNSFSYAPQDTTLGRPRADTVTVGDTLSLNFDVGGASNSYQWLKDSTAIAGATGNTFALPRTMLSDAGAYVLKVTNTVATNLTLYSAPRVLIVQEAAKVEADSVALAGNAHQIRASLPAGFNPTESTLFYRRTGKRAYQSVPFNATAGNVLQASIPSDLITIRGVEYYATFSNSKRTLTVPRENPAGNPLRNRVFRRQIGYRGSTISAENYRMVSVPAVASAPRGTSVLSDDYGPQAPDSWRLLRWNPKSSKYDERPAKDALTPGRSYWLITRKGGPFDVDSVESVQADSAVSIRLAPGCNQVSNPFAFPIAWKSVQRTDKVDAPVRYVSKSDGYAYNQRIMRPWEGYFVCNSSSKPVTLQVPPVEASASDTSAAGKKAGSSQFAANPMRSADYVVQLQASSQKKLADRQNYLGFSEAAGEGRDAVDFAEVPGIGDRVRLSLKEGKHRLAGDFKPAGTDGQFWNFELALRGQGTPPNKPVSVSVTLEEKGRRPQGYELYVLDRDAEQALPVEAHTFRTTVGGETPTRHLRLIIGTPAFAEQSNAGISLTPAKNALMPGYPNPFRRRTTLPFQLSKPADVTLDVYDLLGRKVRTLMSEHRKAGFHRVQWNGRDATGRALASGIYFFRLQAGSFSATRRVVLVH